jgi:uncharacterized membrane protein
MNDDNDPEVVALALLELAGRLAAGEITEEQYRAAAAQLSGGQPDGEGSEP